MRKRKIAFYIESMVVGGAEKVLIDLVNHLDPNKYEIAVIALFKRSVYEEYVAQFEEGFAAHVKYRYLIDNSNPMKYRLFNYVQNKMGWKCLYRYLIKEAFDLEVAFYEGWPTAFVAKSTQRSNKIAWLHTGQHRLYHKISQELNRRKYNDYKNFDLIIGVSNAVAKSFKDVFPDLSPQVLYNPFDIKAIRLKSEVEIELSQKKYCLNFITVGRLIPVKGYDRLLRALSKCRERGYYFHLTMIGDGSESEYLKKLVRDLDLDEDVFFAGHLPNPYPYIKKADCLVCSSHHEGLSTVVIESLIVGTSVLTTACEGMEEILGASGAGLICENSEEGIFGMLEQIFKKPDILSDLKKNTQARGNHFSVEKCTSHLDELLDAL